MGQSHATFEGESLIHAASASEVSGPPPPLSRMTPQGDVARRRGIRSRSVPGSGAMPAGISDDSVRERAHAPLRPRQRSRQPVGVERVSAAVAALYTEARVAIEESHGYSVGLEPEAVVGSTAPPQVPVSVIPSRRTGSVHGTITVDGTPPKHTTSEGAFLRSSTALPPARGPSYDAKSSSHSVGGSSESSVVATSTPSDQRSVLSTSSSLPESGDAPEEAKDEDVDVIAPVSAEGFYFGARVDSKMTDYFEAMQAANLASLDPSPRPSDGEEADSKTVTEIVAANTAVTAASSSVAQSDSWSGRGRLAAAEEDDAEVDGAGDDSLVGCDLHLHAVTGGILDPAQRPRLEQPDGRADVIAKMNSLPNSPVLQDTRDFSPDLKTGSCNAVKMRRGPGCRWEDVGGSSKVEHKAETFKDSSAEKAFQSYLALEYGKDTKAWRKLTSIIKRYGAADAQQNDDRDTAESHRQKYPRPCACQMQNDSSNSPSSRGPLAEMTHSESYVAPFEKSNDKPSHRTFNDLLSSWRHMLVTPRTPSRKNVSGQGNLSKPVTPTKQADQDFHPETDSDALSILGPKGAVAMQATTKPVSSPTSPKRSGKVRSGIKKNPVEKLKSVSSYGKSNTSSLPKPTTRTRSKTIPNVKKSEAHHTTKYTRSRAHAPEIEVTLKSGSFSQPKTNFTSGGVLRALARSSIGRYTYYATLSRGSSVSSRASSPRQLSYSSVKPISKNVLEKSRSGPHVRRRARSSATTTFKAPRLHEELAQTASRRSSHTSTPKASRQRSSEETNGHVMPLKQHSVVPDKAQRPGMGQPRSNAVRSASSRLEKPSARFGHRVASPGRGRGRPLSVGVIGHEPIGNEKSHLEVDTVDATRRESKQQSTPGKRELAALQSLMQDARGTPRRSSVIRYASTEKKPSESPIPEEPQRLERLTHPRPALLQDQRPKVLQRRKHQPSTGCAVEIPSKAVPHQQSTSGAANFATRSAFANDTKSSSSNYITDASNKNGISRHCKSKNGSDFLPRYRPTLRTCRISGSNAQPPTPNEQGASYRRELLSEIRAASKARSVKRAPSKIVHAQPPALEPISNRVKTKGVDSNPADTPLSPIVQSLHGLHEVTEMLKKYMALVPGASISNASELVSLYEAPTRASIPSVGNESGANSVQSSQGSNILLKQADQATYTQPTSDEEHTQAIQSANIIADPIPNHNCEPAPENVLTAACTAEKDVAVDSEPSDETLVSPSEGNEARDRHGHVTKSGSIDVKGTLKLFDGVEDLPSKMSSTPANPSAGPPQSTVAPPVINTTERMSLSPMSCDLQDTQFHYHGISNTPAQHRSQYLNGPHCELSPESDSQKGSSQSNTCAMNVASGSTFSIAPLDRSPRFNSAQVQTDESSSDDWPYQDSNSHFHPDTDIEEWTSSFASSGKTEPLKEAIRAKYNCNALTLEAQPTSLQSRNTKQPHDVPPFDFSTARKESERNETESAAGTGLPPQKPELRLGQKTGDRNEHIQTPQSKPWIDFVPVSSQPSIRDQHIKAPKIIVSPRSTGTEESNGNTCSRSHDDTFRLRRGSTASDPGSGRHTAHLSHSELRVSNNDGQVTNQPSRRKLAEEEAHVIRNNPPAEVVPEDSQRLSTTEKAELVVAAILEESMPYTMNVVLEELLPVLRERPSRELLTRRLELLQHQITDRYIAHAEEANPQDFGPQANPGMLAFIDSVAQRFALLIEEIAQAVEDPKPP